MRLFHLPYFAAKRLFHAWVSTLSYTPLLQTVPGWDANVYSISTISWIYALWLLFKRNRTFLSTVFSLWLTQWKRFGIWPTVFDVGVQHVATLYTLAGGKATQLMVVWIICQCVTLGCFESTSAPVRSTTSLVLCADISFVVYFSIQTEPYPCSQEGWWFGLWPHFLANLLSLCQWIHFSGSFSFHNNGS